MNRGRMVIAAAGLVLVGVAFYRLASLEILDQLRSLPAALAIVVVGGALRLWVQTRAWRTALLTDGIEAPQSRLAGIRLAAQASGFLAAGGSVVAEPAKLLLLRESADISKTAPATLVETSTYWLTTVILGLAGTAAAALLIPGSQVVWLSAGVFTASFVFLAAPGALLSPVLRWAGPKAPRWLRSAERTEVLVRSFRERRPGSARSIFAIEASAQVVTLAEVAAVMWVIGVHVSPLQILAIESAGRLVKVLAAWIPGRLGIDEGGAAASFSLLGLPAGAGLALAVARRVRDLLFALAGAAWAAWASGSVRSQDGGATANLDVLEGALTCKR
ncbi:MAG: lysylphosphatidylglycerol synthase domain-containing protein [Bryobacteraceae bacterium]|nr:lysylphosphatidylglycerol synthase domain-containing protein [Bryobacteraceae bacterium]